MTQTLIQYPLSWLTRSGPQGMLLLLLKTPKQKAPWVQMQWKRGCPCCTHQDTAEWRGGCERQKHFGKRKDKLTNWSNLPLGSGAMNRLLPDQVLFPGSVGRQLLLSFPSCSDLGEGRFPWIRCVRTVFTAAKCGSSGTFPNTEQFVWLRHLYMPRSRCNEGESVIPTIYIGSYMGSEC